MLHTAGTNFLCGVKELCKEVGNLKDKPLNKVAVALAGARF